MIFRAQFCRLVALVALSLAVAQPIAAQESEAPVSGDLKVTLLGTGTPTLNIRRFGAANLVEAGGLKLLFDAGRGASIRLDQLGMTPSDMDAVFLTHFHSDHVNGLADIYLTGYIGGTSLRGRKTPFELYGPVGIQRLADGLRLAHQSDIETRMLDEGTPEEATQINAYENEEGVIFEQNGVKVTVFPVLHGEKVKPSVGYRVDYAGKSVLFSGDTTYEQNIIDFGTDVDLMIHEAAMASDQLAGKPVVQTILAHHTTPEEAGKVFAQTRPGLAVYSHLVLLGGFDVPEVIDRTRTEYDGPLVVGEDLMQFVLSDSGTTIRVAGQE